MPARPRSGAFGLRFLDDALRERNALEARVVPCPTCGGDLDAATGRCPRCSGESAPDGDRLFGLLLFEAEESLALGSAEKSLVMIIFPDEEAYRRGDAVLDAMPSGDTPGRRQSVTKYEVALRAKP